MDTITQGLFGAAVGQVGFRDRIGREAGWVAALCAASPDLDIFTSRVMDAIGNETPLSHLVYHRGASHSLFAIPLIALLFAGAWWIVRRGIARRRARSESLEACGAPPPFWIIYLCCVLAAGTHALLDAFTSYGTQLLWPVSTRFAWDSIPIIDVFISGTFILGLSACYLIRRLKIPRRSLIASSVGALTLLAVMGYIGTGRLMHDRAIDRAMATLSEDERGQVLRADAYPAIGHIFLWRVVIETPDAWIAVRVHHFSSDPPQPSEQARVEKDPHSPWIDHARKAPEYPVYQWFAMERLRPVYKHDATADLHTVYFHDMRYAVSTSGVDSLWPLAVEMDRDGRILSVHRTHPRRDGGFGNFVAMAWNDMWSP